MSRNIGLAAFAGYNYSAPDYEISRASGIDENGNVAFERVEVLENVKFDYFALGATVYMMIW